MSQVRLQQYCSNCQTLLEIESPSHIEPCPTCGLLLSETLEKRPRIQQVKKPIFQPASSIPRLTFDIEQLDSILHFLTINQKICIAGVHTQKIIERLCVRAQLSTRYGGLDSKVLLIDGANSSDLYQCIDFAQQYGLEVKKILNGIISCRTFTLYQLANFLAFELENEIKLYDVKLVIITNLLHYFTNDPYLDTKEMERILSKMIKSLEKIKDCLLVVSLDSKTQFDYIIQKLFTITIKMESINGELHLNLNNEERHHSITLRKECLEQIR